MKRMKFVIILLLVVTLGAKAQKHEPPKFDSKEMASKIVTDLNKQISLKQTLQDSIKVVFTKFFNEMDKDRASNTRPDMDKIKKMEEKRDLKMKTFLTDEQYKTYKKYMEEQHSHRGGPGGPSGENGMKEPPKDGER